MYGTGMRVSEVCTLRVRDIDLGRAQIIIRAAKGDKDRIVMLPMVLLERLRGRIGEAERRWRRDVQRGGGYAPVPISLEHKRPRVGTEFPMQFVFSSSVLRRDEDGRGVRWHLENWNSSIQNGSSGRSRRCPQPDVVETVASSRSALVSTGGWRAAQHPLVRRGRRAGRCYRHRRLGQDDDGGRGRGGESLHRAEAERRPVGRWRAAAMSEAGSATGVRRRGTEPRHRKNMSRKCRAVSHLSRGPRLYRSFFNDHPSELTASRKA
jgi:hypothetical protein